jgi:hypothetical protein
VETTDSWFDPQVEFLEIATVQTSGNATSGVQWKVYSSSLAESTNTVVTVPRDDFGMPMTTPLYNALVEPGTFGSIANVFTVSALAETGYKEVYSPLVTNSNNQLCGQ